MPAWQSFSYAFGPIVAWIVIGMLVIILRWAFARGSSVVARPARPGSPEEYGLLVAVAAPSSYAHGEVTRRRLEAAGVRATLAHTTDGPRIMVWPQDEQRARELL